MTKSVTDGYKMKTIQQIRILRNIDSIESDSVISEDMKEDLERNFIQ